jgi:hypothetical protein
MTTPSARIWEQRADLAAGPELAAYLPTTPRDPETLARAAQRMANGEDRRAAVADFLDDLRLARGPADTARRIEAEPDRVDARTDALLAAVAEHVAVHAGISVPEWTRAPGRFLDHFWWPTPTAALRARALVESPAAFRRRGIFIGATTLQRV